MLNTDANNLALASACWELLTNSTAEQSEVLAMHRGATSKEVTVRMLKTSQTAALILEEMQLPSLNNNLFL